MLRDRRRLQAATYLQKLVASQPERKISLPPLPPDAHGGPLESSLLDMMAEFLDPPPPAVNAIQELELLAKSRHKAAMAPYETGAAVHNRAERWHKQQVRQKIAEMVAREHAVHEEQLGGMDFGRPALTALEEAASRNAGRAAARRHTRRRGASTSSATSASSWSGDSPRSARDFSSAPPTQQGGGSPRPGGTEDSAIGIYSGPPVPRTTHNRYPLWIATVRKHWERLRKALLVREQRIAEELTHYRETVRKMQSKSREAKMLVYGGVVNEYYGKSGGGRGGSWRGVCRGRWKV